jgi:hypothetical protein
VDLLWRVSTTVDLPVVAMLADGSYTSVVFAATVRRPERERILAAARAGGHIDERKALYRARTRRTGCELEFDRAEA